MLNKQKKELQTSLIFSLFLCIDFHFQVFAETSVRDNDVDVSVSTSPTLRLAPEERLFGISCVCFFSILIFYSLSKC
jgi:hypothetical protein